MNTYTIYFKNGTTFTFSCESFSVTYSKLTDEIVGYSLKGVEGAYPTFIKCDEIMMVVKG